MKHSLFGPMVLVFLFFSLTALAHPGSGDGDDENSFPGQPIAGLPVVDPFNAAPEAAQADHETTEVFHAPLTLGSEQLLPLLEFRSERTLRTWVLNFDRDRTRIFTYLTPETDACLILATALGSGALFPILQRQDHSSTPPRCYGKVPPVLPDIQLPCLHFCNQLHTQRLGAAAAAGGSLVRALIIGAADGSFAWKLLHTGAEVWVNDPDSSQLTAVQGTVGNCAPPYVNNLHCLQGNCLSLIEQDPSLINSFDVIYSQNTLAHIEPARAHAFKDLIYRLLAPKGRAYMMTLAIPIHEKEMPQIVKTQRSAGNLFPGHIRFAQGQPSFIFSDPCFSFQYLRQAAPDEKTETTYTSHHLVMRTGTGVQTPGMNVQFCNESILNFYDPQVFEDLFGTNRVSPSEADASFKQIDAFHMTLVGAKCLPRSSDRWDNAAQMAEFFAQPRDLHGDSVAAFARPNQQDADFCAFIVEKQ
jgi:SAM-dependent methyltransferase